MFLICWYNVNIMGFLFSSKNKKVKKVIAIFDIGSGSIGGAIVELPDTVGGLPTIIKSAHANIVSSSTNDFDIIFKNMIRALDTTASNLNNGNTSIVSEVFCILASPWYLSETRVVKIQKETSFIFSKNQADILLKKEIKTLSDIYKEKYGYSDAPELIESLVMGISLDGKKIDEPIGKKCKSVDMDILATLSSKFFLNKITDVVSKTFHHIPVKFSSFVTASYLAVRDRYINEDSYLLIDVGGEVTDISVVNNGVLKYSMSFPQGKKTFMRYISKYKAIELRDAEELFNLFNTENLSSLLKLNAAPIFKSIENTWVNSFNQSLHSLPRGTKIPSLVFLTADNDIKKWLSEVIKKDNNLDIVSLEGSHFLDMCSVKNTTCDPFLMIEAISVMRKMEN